MRLQTVHGLVSARRPAPTTLFHGQEQNSVAGPVVSQRQCVKLREPAPHVLCCHPSSTICIFVITNHRPLFYICIILPVESAPFFIPSTSSVHGPPGSTHLVHITSSQSSPSLSPSITARPFTPDLKLISFTNPFLNSHSYSFLAAFKDLNL